MIVDSSFLVSLFWPDDALHAKAVSDFQSTKQILLIPDRILEEMITVIAYRGGYGFALEVVNKIKVNDRFEIFHICKDEWDKVLKFSSKTKKKISFADYILLYLSLSEARPLLSYDAQLTKLSKTLKL